MTNWDLIHDIYGEASGIPALLDAGAASTDWRSPAWEELWGRLYHQGSVAEASYAAIPALAEIAATRSTDVPSDPALFLAASILASNDGPLPSTAVRAQYSTQIEVLRPIAYNSCALATDDTDFIYALENVAAFEGWEPWGRGLGLLTNGEVDLECPDCGEFVLVELGDAADGIDPAAPADLAGSQAVLYELAGRHGRAEVQQQLLQFFGRYPCPECGRLCPVAGG